MSVDVQERKNVLKELNEKGDTRATWDPTNEDEVANARKVFERLRKRGFTAYTVKEDGSEGEVIHEFDSTAGMIIMTPQVSGG